MADHIRLPGPSIVATFCDDVRQEAGNKQSLMGIYTGEMYVQDFPVLVPKLAAMIRVTTPANEAPQSLGFELLKDGEAVLTGQASGQALSDAYQRANDEFTGEGDGPGEFMIGGVMQLPPLSLTGPTKLQAIAVLNGVRYLAGSLKVSKLPQPSAAAGAAT